MLSQTVHLVLLVHYLGKNLSYILVAILKDLECIWLFMQ